MPLHKASFLSPPATPAARRACTAEQSGYATLLRKLRFRAAARRTGRRRRPAPKAEPLGTDAPHRLRRGAGGWEIIKKEKCDSTFPPYKTRENLIFAERGGEMPAELRSCSANELNGCTVFQRPWAGNYQKKKSAAVKNESRI